MGIEVHPNEEVPTAPTVAEAIILCPLCDYDLRELSEPRCPECGFQFEWEELRNPERRWHPYLFEHHPRRNVRSFVRTWVGGWRPRRFWRTLLPAQPSNPRRLLLYHAVPVLLLVLFAVALAAMWIFASDRAMRATRVSFLAFYKAGSVGWQVPAGLTIEQMMDRDWPVFPSTRFLKMFFGSGEIRLLLTAIVLTILWPWLTVAALLIFQATMRRCRIRSIHLLRCALYSGDLFLIPALVLGIGALELLLRLLIRGNIDRAVNWIAVFVVAALAMTPLFAYRLWMAIRLYLRFDHAFWTMLATQTIVALFAALVFVWCVMIPLR